MIYLDRQLTERDRGQRHQSGNEPIAALDLINPLLNLGSQLIPRVLRHISATAACLVQTGSRWSVPGEILRS
jgi:hypothetical protein